jgi:hypothetical protein
MIATILSGRGGAQHMDAEQYRRCARRYLIRASQMISPVNRVTMIDMAAIWMRMAERANPENLGPRGRIFQYEAFQPEHISVMVTFLRTCCARLGASTGRTRWQRR